MKWKIAFFICLILLTTTVYKVVTNIQSRKAEELSLIETRKDLRAVIEIVNNTDYSHEEITKRLQQTYFYKKKYFDNDTIKLEKINLYFKNGRLSEVENQF